MLFRGRFLVSEWVMSVEFVREKGRKDDARTLVVVQDVPFVISTAVVGFSDGHGVVGEVDIAIVT